MTSAEELYDSFPEEVRNEYEKEYTKEQFVKGFNVVASKFDMIISIAQKIAENIDRALKSIIELHPNKRIVYLTLHGKKVRTRKKNMHRIAKWIERGME